MKQRLSVLLGVAVSGTLLALALRNVSFAEVGRALSTARLVWLAPMLAATVGDLLVRAFRWRLLLRFAMTQARTPEAGVWRLFKLEAIGLGINNVVPMRVGELARAYLAGRELGLPTLTSLATIFVERVFDMMVLLSLFALAGFRVPEVVPASLSRSALAGALGLAFGLLALAYADGQLKNNGPWERAIRAWPLAHRLVEQAAVGMMSLRSWAALAEVTAWSFALWLMDAGIYWMAGRSMGLEPGLAYGRCVVVLATAAGSSMLPAVPGSFGTFEQSLKLLLTNWGVAAATALAFAGFVHLVTYLVVTILGIVFLYQAGHSLGSLGLALRSEKR